MMRWKQSFLTLSCACALMSGFVISSAADARVAPANSIPAAVEVPVIAPEVETPVEDKKVLDVQDVKTESGVKTWLVEDHSVPVIAINFSFHPDHPLYARETQGLTSFLSSMLDEGAGEYDSQSFQKKLEDYNISMSFSGGRDAFSGSLYILSKYQDEAFDLLRLALSEPRFDEEAMERMRRSAIARIRRSMASPRWITSLINNGLSYPDHYYALNRGGTIESMSKMRADDLRKAVKDLFVREHLSVSISGDMTAAQAAAMVDKVFGGLPARAPEAYADVKAPAFNAEGGIGYYVKDIPQTYMRLGWDGLDSHDPDYTAYAVMNYILGGGGFSSKLMKEIREKRGLTYGVYSYFNAHDTADRFHVATSTAHKNVRQMRELILQEVTKMAEEPLTEQELADAKKYLKGSMVLGLTDNKKVSSVMSGLQFDDWPKDRLDGYKDRIDAVSVQDIQRVAKRVFEGKPFIEVYVGAEPDLPAEIKAKAKKYDEIPNAMK